MRTRVVVIAIATAVTAVALVAFLRFEGTEGPRARGPVASAPPDAVTVAAAGDICTESPSSCSPTADLIEELAPDAVLALGDNQYEDGTLDEYLRSYDVAWGRFADITFPVAGNHEWHTGDAQGFLDYFDLTKHWYTFTLGPWRLYALDATTCTENGGCGPGTPQYDWLAEELASRSDRCILAYWHQARFSSGDQHGSHEEMSEIWSVLDEAGADLVLNGHEHNYERFGPQDADGRSTPEGMIEIVAGTGGNPSSYGFEGALPNSEVRLGGFGVVGLTLWGDGWITKFMRPDGRVVDRASGGC